MKTAVELLDPEFVHRLEQLELVSRKIFVGRMKGERRSRRRGSSVEFADHRNYSVGDDLRHIDWNVYARLDRLFVKLFLEEEDLHVHLLIDRSPSMDFGDPTKLLYAKRVAAALAFVGLINADRVELDSFSAGLEPGLASVRGRSQMGRIVGYLDGLEPAGSSDLKAACKQFAIRHTGKGVVIVVSDFLAREGYEDGLKYLLARNFDIYCIQVLCREEIEPDLTGDLRLVDCEDGEVAEVSIGEGLLKRYKATLEGFVGGLKEWCTRRGISYVLTRTDQSFERLILTYLRQRGLIK
jgi:uncharacterized protein (DUF58 family)